MNRPRAARRRVALLGFQGYGNLGDEAVMAGIESLLEDSRADVTLLIGGPAIGDAPVAPTARRLAPRRLLPDVASVRALRRVDALVLAGGGLLNDYWLAVIPRYLAWIVAARLAGVRVVWIGVGVGPIRRRAWRLLARIAARLSHRVLVRDEASAALVRAAPTRVAVMPDPALFLPRPRRPTVSSPTLGIVVRPPVRGTGSSDSLAAALDELMATARREGLAVEVLVMAPAVDAELADWLGARHGAPVVTLGPDPLTALARLSTYQALVSVRLHGLLLASLAGVPCLPIAYDDKVVHASAQLDLADLAVGIGGVRSEDLWERLQRVADPARQRRVQDSVGRLRARRAEVTRLIEGAL